MAKNEPIPVVVDSNALFTNGPTVGNPQFVEMWKTCLKMARLKLLVPDVVVGERVYRLVSIANESVQSAAKNFDNIHAASGRAKPALPSYEQLKQNVEEHFGK